MVVPEILRVVHVERETRHTALEDRTDVRLALAHHHARRTNSLEHRGEVLHPGHSRRAALKAHAVWTEDAVVALHRRAVIRELRQMRVTISASAAAAVFFIRPEHHTHVALRPQAS